MSNGNTIDRRDIQFSYDGSTKVLDIEAITFNMGEITVLRGGNGTGKTTLLKLLAGLLSTEKNGPECSAEGHLKIDNCIYLHQEPYILKGTVVKNMRISFYGGRVNSTERTRRMKESLRSVELEGFENRSAGELSGGEKKRLALARALSAERSVYLLDEPTANVDKKSVLSMETVLHKIVEQGQTVIIASHHDSFAYRIADHIHVLENGRLEPPHENILKGKVSRVEEGLMFFSTGGREVCCAQAEGEYSTAVIKYEDIILSNERITSSAQNLFEGTVLNLVQVGSGIYVTIDCGFSLSCRITNSSAERLGISECKKVFAAFKATAVRLF